MKNWVLKSLSVLALVAASVAHADTLQDGNAAFAKGDFPAAVRAYETALAAGPQSAGLYYNLGTAQMKAGERPQAALSFRRALMLDPAYADARVSLSEIERSQGVPVVKEVWTDKVAAKVPVTALYVSGAVVFWVGAFVLLAGLLRTRKTALVLSGVIVAVLGGLTFVTGVLADPKVSARNSGVIVSADTVPLLSSPADQSATVAKVVPSSAVRILGASGEWTYCQAPGGEKGWLPGHTVKSVIPTT